MQKGNKGQLSSYYNMRSYNNLFENMLSSDAMENAFRKASEGKRERRDVVAVLGRLDYHKAKLKELLETEKLILHKHKSCKINEVNCKKEREIVKPYFKYEQVVHHLVVNELKPIILRGFYEYSCGSIPDRGCHFGKKYIEQWIASFPKDKPIYILKGDIRHFFESIDHDILKRMLRKVIRDKKFLKLLYKIIDNHEEGIPLGYYTSQWFANFYLKAFDHFVKEVLKVPYYIRYMDDLVFISDDKNFLHNVRIKVDEYLRKELKLTLKDNWQVFLLANEMYQKDRDVSGRGLDFMGFKFYRNYTSLRKSILRGIRRKAKRIHNKILKRKPIGHRDASSMISYMGWISHSVTYHYYTKYIKTETSVGKMQYIVSTYDKRHKRSVNYYDRVEECKRLTGNKAC